MVKYDVIIIGAGASGIMAAITASERGRRVGVLDLGPTPLAKVAASGGGRCNFTNTAAAYNLYFGENPNFVRGALSRFGPTDMIQWAATHNIRTTQKTPGQYFCADGADNIVRALLHDAAAATIISNTRVTGVSHDGKNFITTTNRGEYQSESVIVASGGQSFPTMNVSDIGHKIAQTFGHKIVPIRPALCGIKTDVFPDTLAGISMPVQITGGRAKFVDDMLITHFGIGGPAVYRATVRDIDNGITINIMPNGDVATILRNARQTHGRKSPAGVLATWMPTRVAKWVAPSDINVADIRDEHIRQIANRVHNIFIPRDKIHLFSMASAEVVRGGIDTSQISSKTMESKLQSGLYFTGEVIDIAGDLGGFNLQWAWSSGYVAGQYA